MECLQNYLGLIDAEQRATFSSASHLSGVRPVIRNDSLLGQSVQLMCMWVLKPISVSAARHYEVNGDGLFSTGVAKASRPQEFLPAGKSIGIVDTLSNRVWRLIRG